MQDLTTVKIGFFYIINEEIHSDIYKRKIQGEGNIIKQFSSRFNFLWDDVPTLKYTNLSKKDCLRGEVIYCASSNKYIISVSPEIKDCQIDLIKNEFEITSDFEVQYNNYFSVHKDTEEFDSKIFVLIEDDYFEATRIYNNEVLETLVFDKKHDIDFIKYLDKYHMYDNLRNNIYPYLVYDFHNNSTSYPMFVVNNNLIQTSNASLYDSIYEKLGTKKESYDFEKFLATTIDGAKHKTEATAKLFIDTDIIANQPVTPADIDTLTNDCCAIINNNISLMHFRRLLHNITTICEKSNQPEPLLTLLFNGMGYCYTDKRYKEYECDYLNMVVFKICNLMYKKYGINILKEYNYNKFFNRFLSEKYKYKLSIDILRGEKELTGNLIELDDQNRKILIECGTSLANKTNELEEIEKKVLSTHYSAVVITHNHKDHNGLIEKLSKHIPVFMGEKTLEIYKLQHPNVDCRNFISYCDNKPFYIGAFKITPHLCDHSVMDSYMLELDHLGEKILYTGDFRANGRKNYNKLLESLPTKVDTLIIEGTNAYSDIKSISEIGIEKKMQQVFRSSNKPAFVLCTSTNIDRIVSIYKAASSCGKKLLVSIEEAKILCKLAGNVPNPLTFDNVYVYYPLPLKFNGEFINLKDKSLSIDDIAKMQDYVMIVSTSAQSYLQKLASKREDKFDGCPFVYSMWKGYLNEQWMTKFVSKMEELHAKTSIIHTSGHADKVALAKLKARVNPTTTIDVHTKL